MRLRSVGQVSGALPSVLVVEDEAALAVLLQYNLGKEGFRVDICGDGEEALARVDEKPPDIVVLDWMIPTVSGIEVCRRLRQRAATRTLPIILLTARGEEGDRVRGFETGADDYVVKPFLMSELVARVRAVLRRARPGLTEDVVQCGDITLDRASHRVRRDGEYIHLGPTEFRLLEHFMMAPGRVFTREQLLNAVWGSEVYVETRTVDVHVGRLRRSLATPNSQGDPIRTVRSAGYALDR
jgi:two-component system phosphate regulon response regulator PhoB